MKNDLEMPSVLLRLFFVAAFTTRLHRPIVAANANIDVVAAAKCIDGDRSRMRHG